MKPTVANWLEKSLSRRRLMVGAAAAGVVVGGNSILRSTASAAMPAQSRSRQTDAISVP